MRLSHVDAGLHEQLTPFNRGVFAFDGRNIGTGANHQAGVFARIQGRIDLRQHLLHRDDALAREITASAGKDLIGKEQSCYTGAFKCPYGLPHIVYAAKAGIGIRINRDAHRFADAGIVIGKIPHV